MLAIEVSMPAARDRPSTRQAVYSAGYEMTTL